VNLVFFRHIAKVQNQIKFAKLFSEQQARITNPRYQVWIEVIETNGHSRREPIATESLFGD